MNEKYIYGTLQYVRNNLPELEVESHIAHKNNGVELHGIRIQEKGESIAPILYLEGYYERGYTEQECATALVEQYNKIKENEIPFDVNSLSDFDTMRERICYKIINKDANKKMLEDTPYDELADDLVCVYYIDLGNHATITIHNGMLDLWGIREDELYELADRNTQRIYSNVEFKTINEVMVDMMSENGALQEMKIQFGFPDMKDDEFKKMLVEIMNQECPVPLYVLRAVDNTFGASVLMYDNMLFGVHGILGTDFVVLPSSTHEVLVMPWENDLSVSELRSIVKQVNEQEVSQEEQLSDNVYFCNGKELVVLTDDIIPQRYNRTMQEAR